MESSHAACASLLVVQYRTATKKTSTKEGKPRFTGKNKFGSQEIKKSQARKLRNLEVRKTIKRKLL